jgi:virulence factor
VKKRIGVIGLGDIARKAYLPVLASHEQDMVDLLVWLGGAPRKMVSSWQKTDAQGRLRHASGSLAFGEAAAYFSMDRFAGVDLEKLELHGSGRSVEVVNMETAAFYANGLPALHQGAVVKQFGSWDSVLYRRGFAGVIDHFLQTMDAPEECSVSGDLVLDTHLLIEELLDQT